MDMDIGILFGENSQRFEFYSKPQEPFDFNSIFLKRRHEKCPTLNPSPPQVLYAAILLHCRNCSLAPGSCSFPGCRLCKSLDSIEEPESFGSGHHIYETTIRNYILNDAPKEFTYKIIFTRKLPSPGPDPNESDEEDRIEAENNEAKRIENEVGETKWKSIKNDGLEFRYLSRRICRKEINKIVPVANNVNAKVGDHFIEETFIKHERKVGLENVISSLEDSSKNSSNMNNSSTAQRFKNVKSLDQLIKLPLHFFKYLAGQKPDDLYNVSIDDVDPYPVISKNNSSELAKSIYPLQTKFFNWLFDKFSIQHAFDNGVKIEGDVKFDRLIEEKVTKIHNSRIIIQILYGILPDTLLSPDEDSGNPAASVRYYDIRILSDLKEGVTVSVYDTQCKFSRAVQVSIGTLYCWAAQIGFASFDLPQLVSKILLNSDEYFIINKCHNLFISFYIAIKDGLLNNSDNSMPNKKNIKKPIRYGRRQKLVEQNNFV